MYIVRSLTWKKTAVLKYNFKILEILLQNWEWELHACYNAKAPCSAWEGFSVV